jgi:transposase
MVVATLRGGSVSTVINWFRQVQETGSVAPGHMGGDKPNAIVGGYRIE